MESKLMKMCEEIDVKLSQICVQGDSVMFLARARGELAALSRAIAEMKEERNE